MLERSNWFYQLANIQNNDATLSINGRQIDIQNGIVRSLKTVASQTQNQTTEVFGYKWNKTGSYGSVSSLSSLREWLTRRFGDPRSIVSLFPHKPVVLDAGCGAGLGGLEFWREVMPNIHYLGMDITNAVDVAKERFEKENIGNAMFMQENISDLPFEKPIFDIIYCSEVMHHTDSTEETFNHLARHLKPGGVMMFYVYRKKAPIREFADDYIRQLLQKMPLEQAWQKLEPLTKLGIILGELKLEVDVPEDIELLEIPKGKIDIQRLFYWYIFKAFYNPDISFDEMNHINFDWYAPKNAHRHTLEETKTWCFNNHFKIVRELEELPGITIIAQKN